MIDVELSGDLTVIRPHAERLDYESGKELVTELRRAMEDGLHVLLNLGKVTYLNSEALGYITTCARRLHHRQGTIKVCCLTDGPRSLFKITRMDQILDGIFETEVDALASFSTDRKQ